jgi:hypothetical protein
MSIGKEASSHEDNSVEFMHSCMDFHAIELLFTREDFSSAD